MGNFNIFLLGVMVGSIIFSTILISSTESFEYKKPLKQSLRMVIENGKTDTTFIYTKAE